MVETLAPSVDCLALRSVKAEIASDVLKIRNLKQSLHAVTTPNSGGLSWQVPSWQVPSWQSELAYVRRTVRARHILSGLLRGHEWSRMESNHPEGDPAIFPAVSNLLVNLRREFPGMDPDVEGRLRHYLPTAAT